MKQTGEKRRALDDGAYFDRLVAEHEDSNALADRGWATLAKCFVRTIAPLASLRLLDVGCGPGLSRRLYIDHCAIYVGIDLSHETLRRARQKFSHSSWIRGDACLLPFHKETFTVVAFSSVLHHIEDYRVALAEAYAVLRPGGQVFAFDPNLFHPAIGLFRHPPSPLYLSEGVSPNERPLRPSALRAAFASAGFTQIRQYCQANLPYKAVVPKLLNAFLSVYNVGDWLLHYSGLGRWFGTLIITAGRKPAKSSGDQRALV